MADAGLYRHAETSLAERQKLLILSKGDAGVKGMEPLSVRGLLLSPVFVFQENEPATWPDSDTGSEPG